MSCWESNSRAIEVVIIRRTGHQETRISRAVRAENRVRISESIGARLKVAVTRSVENHFGGSFYSFITLEDVRITAELQSKMPYRCTYNLLHHGKTIRPLASEHSNLCLPCEFFTASNNVTSLCGFHLKQRTERITNL